MAINAKILRTSTDYNIKLTNTKGDSVGDIDCVSVFPKDQNEDGSTNMSISFKIKKNGLPVRMKVFPNDTLRLVINGKIQGRTSHIYENIQEVKILDSIDPDDEFEEGIYYQYIGKMNIEEKPQRDTKKIGSQLRRK